MRARGQVKPPNPGTPLGDFGQSDFQIACTVFGPFGAKKYGESALAGQNDSLGCSLFGAGSFWGQKSSQGVSDPPKRGKIGPFFGQI